VTEAPEPARWRFDRVAGAFAVLLAAAIPRFTHLGFGLLHQPDYDERVFVENALVMVSQGDWDHRFYEYPGLLLWVLRVILDATSAHGSDAYFASRVLIASVSSLTAVLVFLTVSAWVSLRAGLVAGLLLALSPLDVETAHMFRPDVVIAPLLFGSLALAAGRDGRSNRSRWTWAFVVAAIATAIKFSAALVFVPLVILAIAAGESLPRIAGRVFLAFGLFAALSPYTFLSGATSLAGMKTQLSYHYETSPGLLFTRMLSGFLFDTLPYGLSVVGLGLAAWGVAAGFRGRSRWTRGWLFFPVLWILVFSTTGARYGRFMVPVLGILCVFAAIGFEDVVSRLRGLAWALAGLALTVSGLTTFGYLRDLGRQTMDLALDWANRAPGIKAVGSAVLDIGALATNGREIVPLRSFRGDPFVASQFDALIMPGASTMPPGFELAARFTPVSVHSGPDLAIFRATSPHLPVALDLHQARIDSSAPDRHEQLIDGIASTRWRSATSPAFIEVSWPSPLLPSRIEIGFGAILPERELQVSVFDDLGGVEAHALRPPLERQRLTERGFSQVVAWPARKTRILRIELIGQAPLRISELKVFTEE
jgi:hypothetical protein